MKVVKITCKTSNQVKILQCSDVLAFPSARESNAVTRHHVNGFRNVLGVYSFQPLSTGSFTDIFIKYFSQVMSFEFVPLCTSILPSQRRPTQGKHFKVHYSPARPFSVSFYK